MKKTSMALLALLSFAAVEAQAENITFVPQGKIAGAAPVGDGLVVADTEDFLGKSFTDANAALVGVINDKTGTRYDSKAIAWYWTSKDGIAHDIINDKTFKGLYASLKNGNVSEVIVTAQKRREVPITR